MLMFFFSSQKVPSRFEGIHNPSFTSSIQPRNLNLMTGSQHCPDVGRDASFFSQATTAIMDTSTIGGDDSFRKQQRGSQGSGGNFSQDKFSFSGSDTIEIMGSFMRSVVRKRVELFCICFIWNFIMLTIPVLFQKPSGPLKKILAFSRT
jgi:hypothetical protein